MLRHVNKIGKVGGDVYFDQYASDALNDDKAIERQAEAEAHGYSDYYDYYLFQLRSGAIKLPSHKEVHAFDYLFGPYDPEIDIPNAKRVQELNQKKTELDPNWDKDEAE